MMLITGSFVLLAIYALLTLVVPDVWWLVHAASHQTTIDKVERTREAEMGRIMGGVIALIVGLTGTALSLM